MLQARCLNMNLENTPNKLALSPLLFLSILASGLLSGLLGIGGGVLLVSSMVFFGKIEQKIAHGTSLCGIVIIASAGLASYIIDGTVNYVVAAFLAPGAWIGVALGTWLLRKISVKNLKLIFGILAILIAIRMLVAAEGQEEDVKFTLVLAISCVLIGLVAGSLAGLLGVGGGIIIVPSIIFFFDFMGADARGSSLLVILPTALIGTYRNYKYKNLHFPTGIKIGVVGASMAFLGAWASRDIVSERVIAVIFGGMLFVIAVKMFIEFWQLRKSVAT